MNSQMNQTEEPTQAAEPAVVDPVQGTTPATNDDDLYDACRQPISTQKDQ